jgi:hypothetical protein
VEKEMARGLDGETLRLAATARDAWLSFAAKEARAESDLYRGGSARRGVQRAAETELEETRTAARAAMSRYRPAATHDAAAERSLETVFARVRTGDSVHSQLYDDAKASWLRYRDEEIALYVRLFGPQFGAAVVADDVRAKLAEQLRLRLEDVEKQGH